MLHASEAYEEAGHAFAAMGIEVSPKLNLAKMLAFKDEGVKGNVDGVAYLLKKNKIEAFHGTATILGPGKVGVTLEGGDKQRLEVKSIVIATGSDVGHAARRRHRRAHRRLLDRRADSRQGAQAPAGGRCRHHRPRAGLGVAPARQRGAGRRGPRPHPARHRRRDRPNIAAHPRQAGHELQAVEQGHRHRQDRGRPQDRHRAGCRRRPRRHGGGGRRGARRHRSGALHGRPRPRGCRRRARRQEAHRRRRALPDQRARHLRHRRCDRRSNAGAQGRGRGRGGGRDHRRPSGPRELRRHP